MYYSSNDTTGASNVSELNYCNLVSYEAQMIASWMDLMNRTVFVSILMFTFSLLTIITIFQSRNRVFHSTTTDQRGRRRTVFNKNDISFAISTFCMNLIFFILNMPVSVAFFVPNIFMLNTVFLITNYLFFFSYSTNFYAIFLTNSLFRNEFYNLFRKKSAFSNVTRTSHN